MIKKIVFWSLMIGGGLFFVNHVVRPGIVGTFVKRAHARFEKKIPPDLELARIRDQIAQLTPDMNRNISRIAAEMVAVESLQRKVNDLQARLDNDKVVLAALTNAIEQGTTRVRLNGHEVSVTQVDQQLRKCRNLEGELVRSRKILEAKQQGVDAARQQLIEMKQQKQELEVLAAKFESDLKVLALEKQRVKRVTFDDSRLAEIKEALARLQERIDVERRTAELAEQFRNDTFTEKPATGPDILTEARQYLGGEQQPIDATKK